MGKLIEHQKAHIGKVAVTATTGALPTPDGAVTVADAATPTVVELLELCMELKAKIDALTA